MTELIQPLFDGPVDIVGDIHGEISALDQPMLRLGYNRDGVHPKGRRLVFVGDLVDRGADSPAVVERVASMVVAGRAQCILGNHELNLLLGEANDGNGWFQPCESDHDRSQGKFTESVQATPTQRVDFLAWMSALPLALERKNLRVVHACWHSDNVAAMRGDTRSIVDIHRDYEQRIQDQLHSGGQLQARERELALWGDQLNNRDVRVPLLNGIAATDSLKQSAHPLKALTSGLETPTSKPFFTSGKWRMSERVVWWDDYHDEADVVMGHYWRWPGSEDGAASQSRGPTLFGSAGPFDLLGPRRNVMCVDWCIGLRWRERQAQAKHYVGKLGALRSDTGDIVLDS